jgi:SAM-dependent methyltransferase
MQVFDFGSNWQAFSAQLADDRRLEVAAESLQALLGPGALSGRSVLDVGCGSGLFSLAAAQLGATRVVGVDINPRCIAVSEQNRDRLAPRAAATFRQASALSPANLDALGQFDIVYAWGSLHHTGAMWDAIRNTAGRVAPGGSLVLAIYNQHWSSPAWRTIKWLYNQLPGFGQRILALIFAIIIYIAKFLVTRRNPLSKQRGMNFWYDVVDWVGGYPYEYATAHALTAFMQEQGFVLRRCIPAEVPTGCNELVFEHAAK